jgi:hypothetical protein
MRALFGLVALLGLATCNLYGPCCSNSDCSGGSICTVDDDKCPSAADPKGQCLKKCGVDRDCGDGEVCNVFILSCACQKIGDGGSEGTCAPGVGD